MTDVAVAEPKWWEDPSFVYALGYPNGPTKIGHSGTPHKRLLAYRKKDGADIQLLAQWEAPYWYARALERYVQWELRHKHINSEWFDAPLKDIVQIVEVGLTLPLGELGPIPPLYRERKILTERHIALFKAGTFDRIAAIVGGKERAEFIRQAVEDALDRRERDIGRAAAE